MLLLVAWTEQGPVPKGAGNEEVKGAAGGPTCSRSIFSSAHGALTASGTFRRQRTWKNKGRSIRQGRKEMRKARLLNR